MSSTALSRSSPSESIRNGVFGTDNSSPDLLQQPFPLLLGVRMVARCDGIFRFLSLRLLRLDIRHGSTSSTLHPSIYRSESVDSLISLVFDVFPRSLLTGRFKPLHTS